MKKLNPIQKSILQALLEERRYLTTTQVAKKAGISWNTADRHLKEMQSWLNHEKQGNRDLWKALPPEKKEKVK